MITKERPRQCVGKERHPQAKQAKLSLTQKDFPIPITTPSQFNSSLVRSLAWSCFGSTLLPGLSSTENNVENISRPQLPLTEERLQWLQRLNHDDTPLREYLAAHCSSPRLGLVFESLWHFFLINDPQTELLAHNLPVRDKGRTLGEYDVIYRCKQLDEIIHLELAVKFYLFVGELHGDNAYSGWLGPNQADRLDRKLNRLRSHQLALSLSPAGQQCLQEQGIPVTRRQVQISGRVFTSLGIEAPDNSAFVSNYPRGHWLSISQFLARPDKADWRYLAKPNWLDSHYSCAEALTAKVFQLAENRPLMLINPRQECIFLTADEWPKLT